MARAFKLINSDGAELDLMARKHFLHSPSGLGYEQDFDTVAAGYDFLVTAAYLQQKTVPGEIAFLGVNPYKDYQDFVAFCAKEPLKLAYRPLTEWYYLNVRVQSLSKTEITTGLLCPVDFLAFGTWYKSITVTKTESGGGAGKTYDYAYPYTYAEGAIGSAKLNNTGSLPSYAKLHILGPCTNPSWALSQGGEVISRGKVAAIISEGNKLVVDSAPASLEIAEYTIDNGFVRNLYQVSDFATARFLIVPTGESTLAFAHEGGGEIEAFVEVSALATSI